MKNYSKNIISIGTSVIDAMKHLNEVPDSLTLFIIDNNQKLIGTITDGDIRRGFIRGLELTDTIDKFMLDTFQKITNGFSVDDFKNAKSKGIRLLPVTDNQGKIEKIYDLKKQKSILPIECMIMAGGKGERLRPLTNTKPKPMLPLGNKPIIEHNIDRLISFGIEKIYISVKYLGQQIVDYLGNGSNKGISIEYIWEDEPLGTAGALSLVKRFETEHILLMNSDLFTDVDFEEAYLNVLKTKAKMGVSTIPYSTKIPYGIFSCDKEYITGIKEKPVYTNYANAGIYILNKDLLDLIPHNKFFNITDLIELLINNNLPIIHTPIVGYWIDIGQHQDYINAQEIIKHTQ